MGSANLPSEESLHRALSYLQSALQILDHLNAPAHIGAHVDLAVCELQEYVEEQIGSDVPLTMRSTQL